MEYRQLGRSGLRVSTLTLGTMGWGGRGNFARVGTVDAAGAARQVDLALDAGVNLIDTADVYSGGVAEEIVGEVLSQAGRRDRILVSTKARQVTGPGPNDGGASRGYLIAAVEKALRRLRLDRLDIFYIHEWDGATPLEEQLEALDTLVRAGRIRYLGCSNFTGWQTARAMGVAERHGYQPFVASQIFYSLQARDAEYELLPAAIDNGLGVHVWSPLAGGLMSGRFSRASGGLEGSRALSEWSEPPVRDPEQTLDVVDVLLDVAREQGVSGAQVALAWLLERPGVSSLVVAGRTEEQLADNLASVNVRLTAEQRARLDEVSRLPLIYPYWHQLAGASERLSEADLALLKPYIDAR